MQPGSSVQHSLATLLTLAVMVKAFHMEHMHNIHVEASLSTSFAMANDETELILRILKAPSSKRSNLSSIHSARLLHATRKSRLEQPPGGGLLLCS